MVFGIVSLMLWALILIVTIKYVLFMLRADNHGEGGTLSLMALAQRAMGAQLAGDHPLGLPGPLCSTATPITPAISVLSAVEGLKLVTPAFEPYVLPITLVILSAFSAVQSRGTARVAAWFGPITAVWFVPWRPSAGSTPSTDDPDLPRISPTYGGRLPVEHGFGSSRRWAPCSWRSRAPRRSTPIWAISAGDRSRSPGSAWCFPRSR